MEIRHLRSFLAIAELGSLTAAAERLNLTQPALGQQMRKLEESLGVSLIERHSRGVRVTDAGQRLAIHAAEILEKLAQTRQEVGRYGKVPSGSVRIGLTPSLGRVIVPELLEVCSDRHPDLKLEFSQGFTDQLDQRIEAGEIDIAVTHSMIDSPKLETIPLYIETLFVIGKPQLVSGLPEPVPLEELVQMPLALDERSQQVRKLIDRGLVERELSLSRVVEIQAINLRRELVMRGRCCSIAPLALFSSEIEAQEVLARRIDLPTLTRLIHLATPRVESLSAALETVRSTIVEIIDRRIAAGDFGWEMPRDDGPKQR